MTRAGATAWTTSARQGNAGSDRRVVRDAAGAGAGIAATFNTPLGGVLFALEILLPEVSNRTHLPVVVATGAATLIGRILIGPGPAFSVPEILFPLTHTFSFQEGLAFVILGVLCGVASWAFIRLLVVMEDNYPRLPGNAYTQNVVGMAVIGLMMIGLIRVFGHGKVGVWANTFRGALLRKRKRGSLPSPSDPRLVTPALLPGDGRGMMGGPDLRNRGEGDDQSQHDAGRQRMVQGGKAEDPWRGRHRQAHDQRHPLLPLGELHERSDRHHGDHDSADP